MSMLLTVTLLVGATLLVYGVLRSVWDDDEW